MFVLKVIYLSSVRVRVRVGGRVRVRIGGRVNVSAKSDLPLLCQGIGCLVSQTLSGKG